MVPLLVAIKIMNTFFATIDTGEMIKIKSFGDKPVTSYPDLPIRIQLYQYPAVFSKSTIGIANVLCYIAVESIIKCVAAMVRTKFFIDTTNYKGAAFATSFFMA